MFKIILITLVIAGFLVLPLIYSCIKVSKMADRKAEQMFSKYLKRRKEQECKDIRQDEKI